MIVRLKKRGEIPVNHCGDGGAQRVSGLSISMFKGCCIEVNPPHTSEVWPCGSRVFEVTDERVLALYVIPDDRYLGICEHFLIDDLNAFDSDFNDEEANEGDLAVAQIPATVQR